MAEFHCDNPHLLGPRVWSPLISFIVLLGNTFKGLLQQFAVTVP